MTVFQEATLAAETETIIAGLGVPSIATAIPKRHGTNRRKSCLARRTQRWRHFDAELDRLADLAGIQPIWWDVDGGYHKVGADTKRALLAAMRLPAATHGDLTTAWPASRSNLHCRRPSPPGRRLPYRSGWASLVQPGSRCCATTAASNASQAQGDYVVLPPQPIGRHRLLNEDRPERFCHLTVAPDACYLPPALLAGERRFGIAAHLYALRSRGDQGIGDFTTLARFAAEAAHAGAAVVGLNPLHALFPHDRSRASPYQPSDRRFLDPIYIDVSGFPGGAELPSPPGPVDYPAVWERKRAILDAAFTASGSGYVPGCAPPLRDFRDDR